MRNLLNTDTAKSAIVSLVASHLVITIVMDLSVELLMSYWAGSRKSKDCRQGGEWLQKLYDHITPNSKRSSLAAHLKEDWVQNSAFSFQMHARKCPSTLEVTVSQTNQYR